MTTTMILITVTAAVAGSAASDGVGIEGRHLRQGLW